MYRALNACEPRSRGFAIRTKSPREKKCRMETSQLRNMTLEQLTDWIGRVEVGSVADGQAMAVLTYRQIVVQIKATDAQIEATAAEARAAEAAAEGTIVAKRNADYLWWSVLFATVAAAASAIVSAYAAFSSCYTAPLTDCAESNSGRSVKSPHGDLPAPQNGFGVALADAPVSKRIAALTRL